MRNLVGQQQSGRVVVGIDGSESSKEALRWAMRQANATGSSVEAIMAWELPTTYAFGAPMPTAYDFAPNCERALHEVVQEVVGEYPGVEVSVVVTEGDADRPWWPPLGTPTSWWSAAGDMVRSSACSWVR